MVPTLITPVQHSTGSPSQSNYAKKEEEEGWGVLQTAEDLGEVSVKAMWSP